MSKVELLQNAGTVEIISGEFEGVKGSASTFTPVHLQNVKLNKGGKVTFNFPCELQTPHWLSSKEKLNVNGGETVKNRSFCLNGQMMARVFEIEAATNALGISIERRTYQ